MAATVGGSRKVIRRLREGDLLDSTSVMIRSARARGASAHQGQHEPDQSSPRSWPSGTVVQHLHGAVLISILPVSNPVVGTHSAVTVTKCHRPAV
ncbi:hypothetical protein SCLCIDRAFT_587851 [Scleroderma citrinum Foug A]|uniref:Uncharacterized protein n=1 Tax=Scleroderma citrinum Foug A TaxID=1036808 RepID=A0A0C3D7C9_9AGAM|nr:hypothetical protein SCLCIDRAFT_587851 [Scleroderma citrinum Foug A]